MDYKYQYKVTFYFDEGMNDEYKIKSNVEEEDFIEEISKGFNEKPYYTFTETEDYTTVLIRTKDVYKVVVDQEFILFDK